MFIRDKHSDESYIHVCDDMTEARMRNKPIEIRLHDIHTFIYVDKRLEHVNYCPYCGADLRREDMKP